MITKHLIPAVVLAAAGIALAACSSGGTGIPEATQYPFPTDTVSDVPAQAATTVAVPTDLIGKTVHEVVIELNGVGLNNAALYGDSSNGSAGCTTGDEPECDQWEVTSVKQAGKQVEPRTVVRLEVQRLQQFPSGLPRKVAVSSMPEPVREMYQADGATAAVQLAPGVWTPLPPGATVKDAAAAGNLDGFCASIHAYERQYLNGDERGGSCW